MENTSPYIPVAGPWITAREGELARDAALTAWGPDHYRFNAQFEQMFTEYIGVPFGASLPHATSGIHLSLAAAGIGPGDEVIGPDVTWIASMAPVDYVGASPIFVDILPDTWCIDPAAVEYAITPATRAIIGVDLYGSMCDWDALRDIADRHKLFLLQDAAQSLGSTYAGQKAGTHGDAAVFSFHGSKTLTTGEGGMVVTRDETLFDRIQLLRDHGRRPGDRCFQNDEVAFKYKMSAVQAALGIAQMERIQELVDHKSQIFAWYADRLAHIDGLSLNIQPPHVKNSYWMVTVVLNSSYELSKFDVQNALHSVGIDTRPVFSRLTELPAYANRPEAARMLPKITAGQHFADHGINLPSGYHVTEEVVARVSRELLSVLDQRKLQLY